MPDCIMLRSAGVGELPQWRRYAARISSGIADAHRSTSLCTFPQSLWCSAMQPGGYLLLKRLGLAHCTEGIDAQKVRVLWLQGCG